MVLRRLAVASQGLLSLALCSRIGRGRRSEGLAVAVVARVVASKCLEEKLMPKEKYARGTVENSGENADCFPPSLLHD
ncbi:hypothetical protein NL676_008548 [Syzygium grande]|nr:hypothetical protein NL676_008548 [Syzygium grande]